jgi:hypothetical protein
LFRNFAALLWRQCGCPRSATPQSSKPTKLRSYRIFVVLNSILDLSGRDIDDQLAELDRVARALETTSCHTG